MSVTIKPTYDCNEEDPVRPVCSWGAREENEPVLTLSQTMSSSGNPIRPEVYDGREDVEMEPGQEVEMELLKRKINGVLVWGVGEILRSRINWGGDLWANIKVQGKDCPGKYIGMHMEDGSVTVCEEPDFA